MAESESNLSEASRTRSSSKKKGATNWSPLAWVLIASGAFFAVFLAVTGIVFLRGGGTSGSSPTKAALFSGGAVGVVELNGVIMDSKKIVRRIERMSDSHEIAAVVVRINSPGGAVAPSQEIYEALRALKKPVVASMSSVAASGGYYVACAAQKVFANPGTITGSIGVIMEFANLSKLYEWAKVKRYSIKTGKFKDAGAEYRDMDPEARALLQGMVDDVLKQFKEAVVTGRKLKAEQVDRIADGRIFSGSQAKRVGLVDELGTMRDAIMAASKLAGIKGKPEVVYPERAKPRWFDLLMDERKEEDAESGSTGLASFMGQVLERVVGVSDRSVMLREPGIYWLWAGGA